MAKSVLNALIGARIQQGALALNSSALFPEARSGRGGGRGTTAVDLSHLTCMQWCADPADGRCGITVQHLLQVRTLLPRCESEVLKTPPRSQMSSGLAFDETYTPLGGVTQMLFNSEDASAVALRSPLSAHPGYD